jgi:hypothetical protein
MGGGVGGRSSDSGSRRGGLGGTDDDGAGQRQPELHTSRRRSVHQRSLPSWLPQAWVGSITHRRPTWIGAGIARVAIWPTSRARPGPVGRADRRSRRPSARLAGRAADRRYRWRPGSPRADRHRGGWPGRQRRQRHASCLDGDRALAALLAAVDRAGPGALTAAGCLGGAAVPCQVRQLQAQELVIGGQHHPTQLLCDPGGDPLVAAAAQGGGRAGVVGDAAGAAAEHQHLDELVEDDTVGMRGRWQPSGWWTDERE